MASSIGPAGAAGGARTGAQYIESLRDGREVWFRGERVADVTEHPAFTGIIRSLARIYDMQSQPELRDVMTFEAENGLRVSTSFLLPRTPQELYRRRANTEVWVRESFGQMGRLSDFCAAMLIGYYDVRDEISRLDPRFGDNAEAYLRLARDHDLCLSHGLHDPNMDKTQRPEQDPDRCVRIVEARDDGLVVRGARFVTLGPVSNEVLISPTYVLNEREAEFALWFALPVNAPGVKQICRESYAIGRDPVDHPVATRFDEQDVLMIFDDALVPWERVFLARQPDAANRLFRPRVMAWAGYSSGIQTLGRLEVLFGLAQTMAETGGIDGRPHVIQELGEFVTYMELLRSAARAAEIDCVETPGGLYRPRPTPFTRAFVTMVSERLVNIIQRIGTSALIFQPTGPDLSAPELAPYIDVYFRGKDMAAADRVRLSKLAWELCGDQFGGRQQLYERLHSGDPQAMVAAAYNQYDKSRGRALVRALLALDG